MSAAKLTRKLHRWGAILTALPVLVVVVSGAFLQLKKHADWIQPPTQHGTRGGPAVNFATVLARAQGVPEAAVQTWDDIDRLDVRPDQGVIKIRCRNRYEIQIDARTGAILHQAERRSDVIESLHDGSFFGDRFKLWVFLPSGLILAGLWATGLYLFVLPHFARRKRKLSSKP